jgi:phosphoribosyl 1,2-cyclic phosphodiesterase
MPMFVRFWGVRGSIPTPGPRTRRYGGNTSCVEIRHEDTLLVCDAGTGLRELGVHLVRKHGDSPLTIHLFLSHPHWDHIQGFPFFGPAYRTNVTIYIYCPENDDRNYRLLSGQMQNAYFPVGFSDLGAKVVPRHFVGDEVTIDDVRVRQFSQRHPGGSLGFRFEANQQSVVYATDAELDASLLSEPSPPNARRRFPHELVDAAARADLLIGDAQYFDDEYEKKVGWGHPRATTLVDFAAQAGVRRLALYHHDPMHSDREVDTKVMMCVERAHLLGSDVEVFGAREGIELKLENQEELGVAPRASAR